MQIRPWPFVEMSKQPDTFIYKTIYLQSIIQKEYCLEVFHGPKVEVTQFPVESMKLAQLFTELFRFLPYVWFGCFLYIPLP